MSVALATIFFGFSAFFCYIALRRLRLRLRQRSIITLVELRQSKLTTYISLTVLTLLIVFVFSQIFDGPDINSLYYHYSLNRAFSIVLLSAMTLLGISIALVAGTGIINAGVIMDKGLTNAGRFYDWYNLHDYLIDKKSRLTVSTEKLTFLTLKGTLPPAKVKEEDIPKLEFILNKNKNKFH